MLLPIYIYGHPTLGKPAIDLQPDMKNLQELLVDMWETMYQADGVGLAAPQIGLNIRLFVVDATVFAPKDPSCEGFKRVFINARVVERSTEEIVMPEGCLSVPGIHEEVSRPCRVVITYRDETWRERVEELDGMRARVVQHEYDHIEGRTFIDRLSPLKRRILRKRLSSISAGLFDKAYRVILPGSKSSASRRPAP
ncbi:MAG: peptide deformylase [Odoribacteraceae bacterium]|jgi:peptide deformylase|nr:peptide deformylase [Odoribacteraceae bacterium]